jgi:hypothetical protein
MAVARQAKKTKRTGTLSTAQQSKGAVVAPVTKTRTDIQYTYKGGSIQTAPSLPIYNTLLSTNTLHNRKYFQIVPGTYGAPDYKSTETQAPQATKVAATTDPNLSAKLEKKRSKSGRGGTLLTQRINTNQNGSLASLLGKTIF